MRILAAQRRPSQDVAANVEAVCRDLLQRAEVDLAVFPELFLSGYDSDGIAERAIAADDPALGRIAETAAAAGTATVVGFAEFLEDGRVANSAACIDADGRIAAIYRKLKLFGAKEQAAFVPGSELVTVPLAGARIGVLICFDMEFPELARALARSGIDLLVTPSANMSPYQLDHELSSRSRALENRIAHVYVNRVGDEAGLTFNGSSKLINPDGTVVARAGEGEELIIGELPAPPPRPIDDVDYLSQLSDPPPVRAA